MYFSEQRIVKIDSTKWYIETRTGYDGPFDSQNEAQEFLALLQSCEAVHTEFSGLEFSPQ